MRVPRSLDQNLGLSHGMTVSVVALALAALMTPTGRCTPSHMYSPKEGELRCPRSRGIAVGRKCKRHHPLGSTYLSYSPPSPAPHSAGGLSLASIKSLRCAAAAVVLRPAVAEADGCQCVKSTLPDRVLPAFPWRSHSNCAIWSP